MPAVADRAAPPPELTLGARRQLTTGAGGYHPCWSPDGTQIAYVSGDWPDLGIYLIPVAGGAAVPVPIDRTGDLFLTWHPSGDRIAFDGYRDGTTRQAIFEVVLATGLVTQLTDYAGAAFGPCWRPDGQRLAFTATFTGGGDIYSLAEDGSDLQRHTTHAGVEWYPHWSPEGSQLTYASERTGNADVWILDLATGEETQFTTDPAHDSRSVWSPDGRWIAWTSDRTGGWHIYARPVTGGGTIWLSEGHADASMPYWAPDGSALCYVAAGQLWIVEVDGITPNRSTSIGGLKAMYR